MVSGYDPREPSTISIRMNQKLYFAYVIFNNIQLEVVGTKLPVKDSDKKIGVFLGSSLIPIQGRVAICML